MKRFLTLFSVLWAALGSAQTTVSFEKIFFETHSREQKYNIQGASITGGKLFQLHDGNKPIVVYDMKNGAFVTEIAVEPTKTWHNNTASFSDIYYEKGDKYPLLYASQENIKEHKAVVYRIKEDGGSMTAEIVQTIIFPEPIEMGLYYPNLALDLDAGFLYLTGFSWASWNKPERGNAVQLLRFRLPSPKEGPVVKMWTKDILERWCFDFKVATQGAAVRGGKLYQVFGGPGNSCIVCTDLASGTEVFRSELNGIPGEPEGLGFHNDRIIVTCNDGEVYRSDLVVK
ncbi:MAG: hypothetical protein IKI00_03330 [Bacteroidales bacterium]|nr:hypothetical protein [Bacteroidales bacterium]